MGSIRLYVVSNHRVLKVGARMEENEEIIINEGFRSTVRIVRRKVDMAEEKVFAEFEITLASKDLDVESLLKLADAELAKEEAKGGRKDDKKEKWRN